jgi:orotidine-5'-phosphate decarboxylase
MTATDIYKQIISKKSFLCVGLDSDVEKIPSFLQNKTEGQFEFNKKIIDATHDLAVSYKINTAFYESAGVNGWINLENTAHYIKTKYPEIFLIADAKRGDIGNTSLQYAKAFFDTMPFDAVTVAPYMGEDSVKPFLSYPNKWVILLALTSNKGADDFQFMQEKDEKLFERVIKKSSQWANENQMMYVVGANRPERFTEIRTLAPNHFLLVPGVGAQGGSLKDVAQYGCNNQCGLLINSSREIIFASKENDFAEKARTKALELIKEMESLLK